MSTELSPEDQERHARVAEFIKRHGYETERYTILGGVEDEIPARTILALFPRGEECDLVTMSYDNVLYERDEDLIGFMNSNRIKLCRFNDASSKESRRSASELNDLPIAVLIVGEHADSITVNLITYDDLDPKTVLKDFQRLCILKRSKNARLQ